MATSPQLFVAPQAAGCSSASWRARPQNTPSFPEPSVHLSRRETKNKHHELLVWTNRHYRFLRSPYERGLTINN